MNKPIKLFIVEGEDRDYRFVDEMTRCFFAKGKFEAKIINLSAAKNIYMLYQQLLQDDFQTDIVEILRDTDESAKKKLDGIERQEIDEVYLFFDYDIHQNNLPKKSNTNVSEEVLISMLNIFDNETENGKLYLSYPMVEALYDYREQKCEAYSDCFIPLNLVKDYKKLSGKNNINANSHFGIVEWEKVLAIWILRLKCLLSIDDLSYEYYKHNVTPFVIFKKENEITTKKHSIFILSAFPEFLFDYFKKDFWNHMVKLKNFNYCRCPKKILENRLL